MDEKRERAEAPEGVAAPLPETVRIHRIHFMDEVRGFDIILMVFFHAFYMPYRPTVCHSTPRKTHPEMLASLCLFVLQLFWLSRCSFHPLIKIVFHKNGKWLY